MRGCQLHARVAASVLRTGGRCEWLNRIITICWACSARRTPPTIKAAYRKLAKEHHPDRHHGCTDKEAQFKAINEPTTA